MIDQYRGKNRIIACEVKQKKKGQHKIILFYISFQPWTT